MPDGPVPYPRPTEAAVLFAHISDPPPRSASTGPTCRPARRGDRRGPGEDAGASAPPRRSNLVEQAEATARRRSRAGVPVAPRRTRRSHGRRWPTRRREPRLTPPPALASTVGDVPQRGRRRPRPRLTSRATLRARRPRDGDRRGRAGRAPDGDGRGNARGPAHRHDPGGGAAHHHEAGGRGGAGAAHRLDRDARAAAGQRRGRRTAWLAGTLAVVAVAGTAGAIAGSSDGETPAPAPPQVAALDAGAAKVSVPATSQRTQTAPQSQASSSTSPRASPASGGELVIGRLPEAGGELLLHRGLHRRRCPRRPSSANRSSSATGRGLSLRPACVPKASINHVQLYVVPTDAGVIGVACVSAAARVHDRLRGGRPRPCGSTGPRRSRSAPTQPSRGRLEQRARRRSATSAASRESALRKAKTRRGQAKAADDVAGALRRPRAARSASRRPTRRSPPPQRTSRPR